MTEKKIDVDISNAIGCKWISLAFIAICLSITAYSITAIIVAAGAC